MKTGKIIAHIGLIVLILLSTGCLGGGTLGTGLSTGFSRPKNKSDIHFILIGTVQNKNGDPLRNVEVKITTSYGIVVRETSDYGVFRAPITISSGERVTIDVHHGKEVYSERSQISPAGAKEVEKTFIIDN